MPEAHGPNPLSTTEKPTPIENFLAYCEAEFERRRNSGESFDEDLYREAMEMTVRKLKTVVEGGYE